MVNNMSKSSYQKKEVKEEVKTILPVTNTDTPMPTVKEPKGKEAKKESKQVIKNISKGHHKVYGYFVKPGGIYEVTEKDLKNEKDTKRIDNAVKNGALERK